MYSVYQSYLLVAKVKKPLLKFPTTRNIRLFRVKNKVLTPSFFNDNLSMSKFSTTKLK